MQLLILHIGLTLSLVLIIPLNGIFLSIIFIIKSGCKPNPNFYLGIFLFIFSIVSFFHLIPSMDHYFLNELVIFPFLFFYNAVMLRPEKPQRIRLHLTMIIFEIVFLLLADSEIRLIGHTATFLYLLISGTYFTASLYLMIRLIQENGLKQISRWYADYREIIVVFLLPAGIVLFNSLMFIFFHDHASSPGMLSKAALILYFNHRIFKRAEFTG